MNILYIDHYAGSLSMGMEFRPFYFAREWQKLGHKVRIIGADFSHLRKTNPKIERDFEIQIVDGIEFQWIKTRTYEGNGVSRAITMFQFCSKLWRNAKRLSKEFKPDLVISSSTYPLDSYPANRIRKYSKCKYIHEAHDLWPLTLTELVGMHKLNPFIIILAIAEKYAFSKSDHVIGVAPNQGEYMIMHGLRSIDKFTYVSNGVVPEDWEKPEELDDEIEDKFNRLKNEGKIVVMYVGGHAISNSLDIFIDAAKDIPDNVVFVLVGKGVEKERLIKKAGPNVLFLPPVKKTQIPTILSRADILYLGAEKCSLYRYGVSMNKVYDYMMSGKPILYGVDAWNNDIKDSNCGITIEPCNKDSLINGLNALLNLSDAERSDLGKNGQKKVLNSYTYDLLSKRFLEKI